MNLKKEFGIATLANWSGTFFSYLIAFFATPIIVSSFGDIRYGIWSLAISFTGYYGMLDFGISSSIQKYYSEYLEQKKYKEANAILNAALFLYLAIVLLLMVVVLILVWRLEFILNLPVESVYETKIVFVITALSFGLELVGNAFRSVVVSYRKFVFRNTIQTVFSIIKSIGIIIILKMGYSIIGAGLYVLALDLIRNIIYFFYVFKLAPFSNISLKHVDSQTIKNSYAFTAYNFIRMVSMRVLERSDLILVGMFFDMKTVTLYSIGESLCRYGKMIPKGVRGAILPFASKLSAGNKNESLRKMGLLLPKYTISLLLGFLLSMAIFGQAFIEWWMGPGYNESWIILIILLSSQIFFMSQSILIHILIGMGENRFFGYLGIVEAVFKILSSVLLLKVYDFYGIAVSSFLVFLLTSLIITPWYALNKLGIKKSKYYYSVIIKPIVLSLILYVVNRSIGENLLYIPLVGLEYVIVFYLFVWEEIKFTNKKFQFQIN